LSALPADERRVVLQSWTELLHCRLRLRFPRVLKAGELAFGTPRSAQPSEGVLARPLAALFELAQRTHVHSAACLLRALALRRVLQRHGVDTRLRLGMRKSTEGWMGHAWLEYDGAVLGDREEFVRTFIPFRETKLRSGRGERTFHRSETTF
jgi:hypothetical protein